MTSRKIAVIVGSMRKESFNRKVAKSLIALAPATLELEIVEIAQLPMYNQDEDDHPPAAYVEFRDKIRQFDGVLICTPEYNRGVPGVLKNALDVGSRPYGHSVWTGLPCAVVSVSLGAQGGFGANHHVRQTLVALNMPTLAQPEVYIGNAGALFDGATLINDGTKAFLQKFVDAYAAWVERHAD